MDTEECEVVKKMQQFLIANAKQVYRCYELDCFDVFIHEKEKLDFLNYAIPTKSISIDFSKEYSEINKIFKENDREVRFEFLEEFTPQLPSLLSHLGLKEEYRIDFMICTKDHLVKPIYSDCFTVLSLNNTSPIDKLKDFKLIQELSFNKNANIQVDLIDEKEVISSIGKGIGFIGCIYNMAVSACQHTAIVNGITELVSVSTLLNYRSRGFGSIISAIATEKAFENGATIVCLSAADIETSKLYANIGFEKIATMLAYS